MRSYSLRVRLLAGAALAIVLALGIAGWSIVQNFAAALERDRFEDLEVSFDRLVAEIDPTSPDLLPESPLSDPRYEKPLGGLYWQVKDLNTGRLVRSRSLWDTELELPTSTAAAGNVGLAEIPGPSGQSLIVLGRDVSFDTPAGEKSIAVSVAERPTPGAVRRFGTDLAIGLAILAIVFMAAAVLGLRTALLPLRLLRKGVEDIRRGTATRLKGRYPTELQPAIEEVNELLIAHEAAVDFARERAADLAHGLKTPLAVLAATAERLRGSGNAGDGDFIAMLGDQMNARIEYQLSLARLRLRTRARGSSSSLNSAVLRSVAVLRRTEHGEKLNWRVDLQEDLLVDIDEHDLMELAGVLLENACKWARATVAVQCRRGDDMADLEIDDDGAGLTDEQIASLGPRGQRLDESRPGEGLGLAIVFDILKLNGGDVSMSRSDPGGLRVSVRLPLAAA
ncbi:MAG TPA: HAMP domain-containing sensor histidine kinase [Alphaproteobacteria bacterium]|nr:HAMP domain-containing sensor histidine kinase [Alphaproteobacteria bacterium]